MAVGKSGSFASGETLDFQKLNDAVGNEWVTGWSPSWSGITIGNATVLGRYRYVGSSLEIAVSVTVGSTTVRTGNVQITLPSSHSSLTGSHSVGNFYNYQSSTTGQQGTAICGSNATKVSLYLGTLGNMRVANPATFATGDFLWFQISVGLATT